MAKKQEFGAVVIYMRACDPELRDAKAVVTKEVQRRFHTKQCIDIKEIIYSSMHDLFVAIFKLPKRGDKE